MQIGDVLQPDTTPAMVTPTYRIGDFDGYAVQVQVTDGVLRIAPAAGAVRAKLSFVDNKVRTVLNSRNIHGMNDHTNRACRALGTRLSVFRPAENVA